MADRNPERTAVLLLAHGTPETLDDIPAYLRNVVSGRPMPDHVVEEIRHRYALIGKSPLTEITMVQGQLLAEKTVSQSTSACATGSPTSPTW